MKKLVGYGLSISAMLGIMGTAFSSNVEFSSGLYYLAGVGLYIFGVWAAVLLLKK
jgi:hypothetical protein